MHAKILQYCVSLFYGTRCTMQCAGSRDDSWYSDCVRANFDLQQWGPFWQGAVLTGHRLTWGHLQTACSRVSGGRYWSFIHTLTLDQFHFQSPTGRRLAMEISWSKLADEIRQKIKSYTQLVDGWHVCKKSVSERARQCHEIGLLVISKIAFIVIITRCI